MLNISTGNVNVVYPDVSIPIYQRAKNFLCISPEKWPPNKFCSSIFGSLTLSTSHTEQSSFVVKLYQVCAFLSSKFTLGLNRIENATITGSPEQTHAAVKLQSAYFYVFERFESF